jgi:hypothetical protein
MPQVKGTHIRIPLEEAKNLLALFMSAKLATWNVARSVAFSNFSRKVETAEKRMKKNEKVQSVQGSSS